MAYVFKTVVILTMPTMTLDFARYVKKDVFRALEGPGRNVKHVSRSNGTSQMGVIHVALSVRCAQGVLVSNVLSVITGSGLRRRSALRSVQRGCLGMRRPIPVKLVLHNVPAVTPLTTAPPATEVTN